MMDPTWMDGDKWAALGVPQQTHNPKPYLWQLKMFLGLPKMQIFMLLYIYFYSKSSKKP